MMLSEDIPNFETQNRMVFNADVQCIACGNKVSNTNIFALTPIHTKEWLRMDWKRGLMLLIIIRDTA